MASINFLHIKAVGRAPRIHPPLHPLTRPVFTRSSTRAFAEERHDTGNVRKSLLRSRLLGARAALTPAFLVESAGSLARQGWNCPSWPGRPPWPRTCPWAASRARARCSTRSTRAGCGSCSRSCSRTTTWTGPRTRARTGSRGRAGAARTGRAPARPGGGVRGGRRAAAGARGGRARDAARAGRRLVRPGPRPARTGRPGPALVVLLYADEVVGRVPEEPHDHPCTRW